MTTAHDVTAFPPDSVSSRTPEETRALFLAEVDEARAAFERDHEAGYDAYHALAGLAPEVTERPDQPEHVVLVVRSPTDWTVTWEAPSAGPTPTGYKIQFTPQGGSLTTDQVAGGTLTYTGTADLGDAGDNVTVYVRATNSIGDSVGAQSNVVTLAAAAPPA